MFLLELLHFNKKEKLEKIAPVTLFSTLNINFSNIQIFKSGEDSYSKQRHKTNYSFNS